MSQLQDLHSLVKHNTIKFKISLKGKPVSRGEVEEMSTRPKQILKGGSADRLWTLEPIEDKKDQTHSLKCIMKCDGATIGHKDGLLYAFIEKAPETKWVITPGQNIDGSTGMAISVFDSVLKWRDPGPEGPQQIQVDNSESIVPEYVFELEPVFKE